LNYYRATPIPGVCQEVDLAAVLLLTAASGLHVDDETAAAYKTL
jgi:hypothetical protein